MIQDYLTNCVSKNFAEQVAVEVENLERVYKI